MTIDLESDFESDSYFSLIDTVPKILDMFDDFNIKSTFFVVGNIAERFEDLLKEVSKKHEIASHSHTHRDLSKLSLQELDYEVSESKRALDRLGIECKGFRAPMFKPHEFLHSTLFKHGYKYSSSVSSSHPPFFMNPFVKTKPYRKHIFELPCPQFISKAVPAGLFYYRTFYPVSRTFNIPYMFYLHPYELLEKKVPIKFPTWKKVFSTRNLGTKGWRIFREMLERVDGEWVSCGEYLSKSPHPSSTKAQ